MIRGSALGSGSYLQKRHRLTQTFLQAKSFTIKPLKRFNPKLKCFTKTFIEKWDGRYDYLTEPTKRVLELLDEYDMRATFFVVADVVEHYPGLVESIVERGHEIGCHGLHHACKKDPKTKEPLMSIKGGERYDAPDEEVANGKRNVSAEVRCRR